MNKKLSFNFDESTPRLPVIGSVVVYLFLEHLEAAAWVWGAVGTVMFAVWIGALMRTGTRKQIKFLEHLRRDPQTGALYYQPPEGEENHVPFRNK